jgi:CDP-diacylglycerol---glycerol-3-phosphate 3-phosphatidyltransferase
MFDGHLRFITDRAVKPVGNGLSRLGVRPDHLTILGLVMSVAAAVTIGSGHLFIGFLVLVGSALPDLFDGAVAKAGQSSSIRGAFFDSTADRVTDAFLLAGVAWHLQATRGGQAHMLAFAILGVSTLISYTRAKAEIYGLDAKGGLMERAERIIVLCVGLVISRLLVPVLWLMLVLSTITAIQRFVKVWRQMNKPPVPVKPEPLRARTVANRRTSDRSTRRSVSVTRDKTALVTWRERTLESREARRVARPEVVDTDEQTIAESIAAWRDRMKHRAEK